MIGVLAAIAFDRFPRLLLFVGKQVEALSEPGDD